MALEPEKQKIAVQMPSRTLRTFRPSFPSIQLPGVQRLARTLDSIGETEAKAVATEDANKAAQAVSVIGPDGKPMRPPVPEEFGRYATEIYNKAVDQRYITAIKNDTEEKLNNIIKDNLTDPTRATELMKSVGSGVLSSVDPRVRGVAEAYIGNAINSRARGIGLYNARLDRSNLIENNKTEVGRSILKGQDAYLSGDVINGDKHFLEAQQLQQTIIAQKGATEGSFNRLIEDQQSLKAVSGIFFETKNKIEAGEMDASELKMLTKIINGSAKETDRAAGIDKAWVEKNIPNPATKSKVLDALNKMYQQHNKNIAIAQRDYEIKSYFVNPNGPVPWKTEKEKSDILLEYARQRGINLGTAQGWQTLYAQTNHVPEAEVKRLLINPQDTTNGDVLLQKAQIYRQLKNMIPADLAGSNDISKILSKEDRAFYEHYTNFRAGGDDHTNALTRTRTVLKSDPEGISASNPFKFIQDKLIKSGVGNYKKPDDVYKFIQNQLPRQAIFKEDIRKLPPAIQNEILQNIAGWLALGVPMASTSGVMGAVENGYRDFKAEWVNVGFNKTNNPMTGSGWVRQDLAIPVIKKARPYGGVEVTREWAKDVFDRALKISSEKPQDPYNPDPWSEEYAPKMFFGDKPLPSDAKVGVNIVFKPTGNGTFIAEYDTGNRVYTVTDSKQVPIIWDLKKYAESLQSNVDINNMYKAETRQAAIEGIVSDSAIRANNFNDDYANGAGKILNRYGTSKGLPPNGYSYNYDGSSPAITSELFPQYNIQGNGQVDITKEYRRGGGGDGAGPLTIKGKSKDRPRKADVTLPGPADQLIFKDLRESYENEIRPDWSPNKNNIVYVRNAEKSVGVNNLLFNVINMAASTMPDGYEVGIKSGHRKGDKRQHGAGTAIDIVIYKDGKALPDYQNGKYFRIYEQFAQQAYKIQREYFSELTGHFRWGGYFSHKGSASGYGAIDLMHFDIGSSESAMYFGTWNGGIKPGYRKMLSKVYPGLNSRGIKEK